MKKKSRRCRDEGTVEFDGTKMRRIRVKFKKGAASDSNREV